MQPPFDIAADLDTPVSAWLKLTAFEPRFLLESVEGGERLARYSFLGFGTGPSLELYSDRLSISGSVAPRPSSVEEWSDVLRRVMNDAPDLLPQIEGLPYTGGLVGAFGYDVVRYFERLPPNRTELEGLPQAALVAPASVLVFDHLTRRVALLHSGSDEERRQLRYEVIHALRGGIDGRTAAGTPRRGFSPAAASFEKAEFMDTVRRCKDYIAAGDIYQIVMSVRFAGAGDLDPFSCYRAMRLLNPSPYMFFFESGSLKVAGASPEALVRLDHGHASLRPIAGTRPRGSSRREDVALEEELLADPKENAEHVMLVDLARNDLGRVAEGGSVHVNPYRKIERYSHVMHIVSGVRGMLKPEHDALDLFAATFPAGTLVGAPKVRAMELIAELEPVARGLYGGSVGYLSRNGNMDQAITIRTLVFHGDEYSFQAGAGIVADSDPDFEHREVMAKSAILRRAMEIAEEGL
ncbi:MAG: chorismate-binding protein [Rhodospirillaceae bacterium]|nr:chorismate-binding protein [Rhodospirillaceae bacterium]